MSRQHGCWALCLAWLLLPGLAQAQQCSSCGTCGTGQACSSNGYACKHPCPPHFKWWSEGPPRICFKCGCPRPVCDPCSLERFGYYQTCWQPWPYAPDWSHCPYPPSGTMLPPPAYPPYSPKTHGGQGLPGRPIQPEPESPVLPSPRTTPAPAPLPIQPPTMSRTPTVRLITQ
ncbi:MAG: hypothetical protein U0840_07875 [Gemmataceae bacterium]